jgi:hypothetical protein
MRSIPAVSRMERLSSSIEQKGVTPVSEKGRRFSRSGTWFRNWWKAAWIFAESPSRPPVWWQASRTVTATMSSTPTGHWSRCRTIRTLRGKRGTLFLSFIGIRGFRRVENRPGGKIIAGLRTSF